MYKCGGGQFCLKIDILKFYPSLNQDILKQKLRTKFKDNNLLGLFDEIIGSFPIGVPLGNLLSQHFANFYLNSFDHWLKQDKKVDVFRYCDDICIIHKDKEFLHKLRVEIQEKLLEIDLQLSNYQVFPVSSGIDFVGYVSYPGYILLRKSIKQNWKRMLKKYRNRKSIASYKGWLKWCNSINLVKKYLG